MIRIKKQRGLSLIVLVIALSAIGVAMSTVLMVLGSSYYQTTQLQLRYLQSKAMAESCVAQAMQEIKDNRDFLSTGSVTTTAGDCTFSVSDLGSDNRLVQSQGTVGDQYYRVEAEINIAAPTIQINFWQLKSDFN